MNDKYTLEGQKPVLCNDLMKWAKWYETADRVVAKTQINDEVEVSTVFLGLDHSFGKGDPLVFETMIFGGNLDQEQDRYSTWEQAEQGHKHLVEKANTVNETPDQNTD